MLIQHKNKNVAKRQRISESDHANLDTKTKNIHTHNSTSITVRRWQKVKTKRSMAKGRIFAVIKQLGRGMGIYISASFRPVNIVITKRISKQIKLMSTQVISGQRQIKLWMYVIHTYWKTRTHQPKLPTTDGEDDDYHSIYVLHTLTHALAPFIIFCAEPIMCMVNFAN